MNATLLLRRLERYTGAIFAASVATMLLTVVVARSRARGLAAAQTWVSHTYDVLGQLTAVTAGLTAAESAERGYALTGDSALLAAYQAGVDDAARAVGGVRGLVADNPRQEARATELAVVAGRKVAAMDAVVRARRDDGQAAAAALVAGGRAPGEMRSVARAVAEMKVEELRLLRERRATLVETTRNAAWLFEGLGGASLVTLVVAFATVSTARRRERLAEERATTVRDELRVRVAELEWRGRESRTLSQLSEALQLCLTQGEAYDAVERIVPTLFGLPAGGGVLAVTRASRNRVEPVARWGDRADDDTVLGFAPEDCCALRSGRQYVVRSGEPRLRCAHVAADVADYVCLPLAAHGETLGVLHVGGGRLEADETRWGRQPLALLREAGEHVAVALANLALRDRLKQQSIRDALTGAFNRRYLEESLDREVARARRHRTTLGLLMLDVDHFKRINDRHGHEAGDEVLRYTAEVLRRTVRDEDVVCRYGGEEFAVLLPDISPDVALGRAEAILEALRAHRIAYRGESIGSVTASVGVALFPLHGEEGGDVLRRADEALYAAKRAGRDRVVAAGA